MAEEKISGTEAFACVIAGLILTATWITDTKLWNWYVAAPFKVRAFQLHEVAGLLALRFAIFPSRVDHSKTGWQVSRESIALLLIVWTIVLAIRIAGY